MLNVMLFGVMIMQTFEYSRTHCKDPLWIRSLVIFFFLGDATNTGFNIAQLYISFINMFGNPEAISEGSWTGVANPVLTSLMTAAVQAYFAYIIWGLSDKSPSKYIPIVVVTTAVLQAVAGIVTAARCVILDKYSNYTSLKLEASFWLSFALVGNILITGTLTWYLSQNKRKFTTGDDIISKAVRLVLQTNLAATLIAAVDLILFLSVPNNLHLIFNIPLCQLYTNCVMSLLNAAPRWKPSSHNNQLSGATPSKIVASSNMSSVQYSQDVTVTSRGSVHVFRPVIPPTHSHQAVVSPSPVPEDKAMETDVPTGLTVNVARPEQECHIIPAITVDPAAEDGSQGSEAGKGVSIDSSSLPRAN